MKKLKKVFTLLLVGIMCVTLISGCVNKDGSKESSKGNENKGANTSDETSGNSGDAAKKEEVITIDWLPQNDAPVDPNSPIVKDIETAYNIKFNFIYLERSKEAELLNLRISSGDIPDLFRLNDTRFRHYIQQGVLAEIPEDMVKNTAPFLYELVQKNGGKAAWEFPKENGKLYGIPSQSPDGQYHFVPIWRDDWLKNVGIDKVPETLEEAEKAFYKFVKEDPDQNGANDTYALSDKGISVIFGAFGALPYGNGGGLRWIEKDNKAIASAVIPEMKEALILLNKWYKDGLIDPEFISGESKGQYWGNSVTFWNNKIGFTCPGMFYHVNPPYSETDQGSNNYQNFKKLQGEKATYKEGKPLVGPQGKAGTESWGVFSGNYNVIGKDVANQPKKMEKILEIANRTLSDFDMWALFRYGIKGQTYDIVDGNYTYIGDALTVETRAKLGVAQIGFNANNFEFYNKTQPTLYDYADKVAKHFDGYYDVVWGNLESYPQYKSVVEKKITEAYILFISGERNIDEFDKFVEQLNKAGLEQLTKEANEWYSKFYK